jgi:hypothetical protein
VETHKRPRKGYLRSLGRAYLAIPVIEKLGKAYRLVQVLSFATLIIGTINYTIPTGHTTPNFIYALYWWVFDIPQ